MKNINSQLFALILTVAVSFFRCSPNEPTPNPPEPTPEIRDTLTLTLTDKTHRSVTLNVKTTANAEDYAKNKIKLIRKPSGGEEQDTLVAEYSAATLDTTIIDDNEGEGLLLETSYLYYAVRIDSAGAEKDSSAFVTAQTLGATSHDYAWEEITIGDDGYPNALYDVWGTDENNVYAVGGVRINDTTYGVIHWDGSEWEPIKKVGGVYAIFGFNEEDIWAVGGAVEHFDGYKWERIDAKTVNNQDIVLDDILYYNRGYQAIWGTSSNNLYLGNSRGKIVHWDGSRGSLTAVQTTEGIRDIWGFDANDIYAAAGTQIGYRSDLYHYDGKEWKIILKGVQNPSGTNEFKEPFLSVWGYESNLIYLAGQRLFIGNRGNWSEYGKIGFTINKIRGRNVNDIFAVGGWGYIGHYNGIDWKKYMDVYNPSNSVNSIFITQSIVFAVGYGEKAIIIYGKKY